MVGLELRPAGRVEAFGQLGPQLLLTVGRVVPAEGPGDVVVGAEAFDEELAVASIAIRGARLAVRELDLEPFDRGERDRSVPVVAHVKDPHHFSCGCAVGDCGEQVVLQAGPVGVSAHSDPFAEVGAVGGVEDEADPEHHAGVGFVDDDGGEDDWSCAESWVWDIPVSARWGSVGMRSN
ncbi:hypothetical protein [Pseudonocardia parietis]|uniref:Uncharacterized protein n=1 Tax=Pseudonocardia parietis TaxID=570936 RepID=A0ABS4W780_9PSEU|nr:hypothetical protein [Pseudonocardia parietis]MBP2372025.1 hypothetical protein [Pseudonocardia parietis]